MFRSSGSWRGLVDSLGLNGRQLAAWVRSLARAANQGWQGQTPEDHQVMQRFWAWYGQQEHLVEEIPDSPVMLSDCTPPS